MADKITNLLPKLSYTSTGLSVTKCTIDSGGYAKYGNIVIINIRIILSNSGPSISGFPRPFNFGKNTISIQGYDGVNEKAAFGYVNDNGVLTIPAAYGATGTIMITAMYLTID